MRPVRARIQRDERGASLMLAIGFMLVIGAISAALLPAITSGLNDRIALDSARNREYAADGLIEYAIAQARVPVASWDAGTPPSLIAFVNSATSKGCGGQSVIGSEPGVGSYAPSIGNAGAAANLNSVPIHVDCIPGPTLTRSATAGSGYLQRNVIFVACPDPGASKTCTDGSTIMRAQVNFSDTASGPTTVQAWSVNG